MAAPRILVADGEASTAEIAEFERDRRELIRRGLALGGAAIAASSIPLLLSVRNAFAADSADDDILRSAIKIEQVAVLAYGKAIDGGLLSSKFTKIVQRFRDHEQQHADALSTALTDLGGTLAPKATAADIDGVVKGLGDVKSQGDVANFAIELEMAAVAAYYDAQGKLVDAKLLQMGASIMANQAQHLVVLRQSVKKDAVPNSFEIGKQ